MSRKLCSPPCEGGLIGLRLIERLVASCHPRDIRRGCVKPLKGSPSALHLMRTRLKFCLVVLLGCLVVVLGIEVVGGQAQARRVAACQNEVKAIVAVGDDIFKAKQLLIDGGFSITAGPLYPTKTESYLTMYVDYDEQPSSLSALMYSMGIGSGGSLISGVITADPDGRITEIE